MVDILVRLMFLAALTELGLSLTQIEQCHSRERMKMIEMKSRDILNIDWKPISVFPEEAKKFR